MKANVLSINTNVDDDIERKLKKMKKLDLSIKELEAEYNMLKKQVIDNHFNQYSDFRTEKGLILATYNYHIQKSFNCSKFKEQNPDLFSVYQEEKIIYKFLLK